MTITTTTTSRKLPAAEEVETAGEEKEGKKAKVVKEKVKATKDKPNKPKKKRTLKAKFFMILAAVLGLYCVAVLGYFGWTYINDNPDDDGMVETPVTKISEMVTPKLP